MRHIALGLAIIFLASCDDSTPKVEGAAKISTRSESCSNAPRQDVQAKERDYIFRE